MRDEELLAAFADLKDAIRHNGIEIEHLRSQMQGVNEGVDHIQQQLQDFRGEVDHRFIEVNARLDLIEAARN